MALLELENENQQLTLPPAFHLWLEPKLSRYNTLSLHHIATLLPQSSMLDIDRESSYFHIILIHNIYNHRERTVLGQPLARC